MPALADPTLQTKGSLSVGLKLDNNAAYVLQGTAHGMPVKSGALTYGPPNEPPPPWTQGTQYFSGSGTAYGAQGMIPSNSVYSYQAGMFRPLWVKDMSANAVMSGKRYVFTFPLGSQWIQLYVRLTGGPDGTRVLPGFGLWSLGSNPHAWTYVTPEEFTGDWMIGLLSPACFNVVWLSADYAPPKDYLGQGNLEARLSFTVSGLSLTNFAQSPSGEDAGHPGQPGQQPIGLQHLHPRSHPHILRRGEAPVG